MFARFTGTSIPIHMALSTEIRVSCLIATADCQRALQVLHDEFFGAAKNTSDASSGSAIRE